ncbi:hypothetical protein QE438_001982 [Pseudoxanthomonas sp. SORGH_AS 997]|jgi:hypothetical protein|uniref:Uncharacterized protein n=1 Tax=Pseudoxanthomonas winnipegensis TaxID=2480810 RepID=A0AAW8G8S2_9GAMM|nr:hypothetical protein [Pseudoxanthomonas winnipegensis]MDQ1135091.1 hypothetical protein [Pseudoxanthomonas winnipegensis]MDR6138678.1 hypothetical protein [Pseudoxanthomonas sp. SORGH_AS_0997]
MILALALSVPLAPRPARRAARRIAFQTPRRPTAIRTAVAVEDPFV